MKSLKVFLTLASLLALAACGSHGGALPNAPTAMDSANSLPGDSANSLPGDSANSLPGAQLSCGLQRIAGAASCTIAINLNVPPVKDATQPANLLAGLHPADLSTAYALPSQNPGGTVAIVDAFDDPSAEADLAVYRATFGLPGCTSQNGCFRKLNQRGQASAYPGVDLAWAEEVSLDLDVVSAVCPKCSIVLVEANSTSIGNLGTAVDTAAGLGARAISNSYYTSEWSGEPGEDVHYNHPGVAVTVSAGDASAPFYPAASPYVTSVGGTSLSGSAGSWRQTPWQYGGQGCSAYETKPAWQGKTSCRGMRSTVDVAAVADPQTGVTMYDSTAGGWLVAGGTSVGAPLIAAAYALSGNPQGPAYAYAHPGSFSDIAPVGYDLATGLGSPHGVGGL